MSRLMLAIKLFFKVLSNPEAARRAAQILEPSGVSAAAPATPVMVTKPAPAPSMRNDALSLLAVLQREARLIDFLKEEISAYADAQIGAAVRDVHRDAAAAIERLFALRPVIEQTEGSQVSLPATPDAARIRIVGNVSSTAPTSGRLQHGGWQANKAELPQYTGSAESARIIAPAEVEV